MDFPAVLAVLNDLPSTFKRSGAPYTQLIDSIGSALTRYTLGEDFTFQQVLSFSNAVDGWLDLWGLLWGVPRNQSEGNLPYSLRIQRTVLAWVGTVPAIQAWLNFYAAGGTVAENFPATGYTITMPATATSAQLKAFFQAFNRIRPAGVPILASQVGSGVFLGTEEFLGTGTVVGSYLSAGTGQSNTLLGASTPNSTPSIPTLFMTDPTLNPSLSIA